MKEYTEEECWRNARRRWGMAGQARQGGEYTNAAKHVKGALEWEVRARRIARGEE